MNMVTTEEKIMASIPTIMITSASINLMERSLDIGKKRRVRRKKKKK